MTKKASKSGGLVGLLFTLPAPVLEDVYQRLSPGSRKALASTCRALRKDAVLNKLINRLTINFRGAKAPGKGLKLQYLQELRLIGHEEWGKTWLKGLTRWLSLSRSKLAGVKTLVLEGWELTHMPEWYGQGDFYRATDWRAHPQCKDLVAKLTTNFPALTTLKMKRVCAQTMDMQPLFAGLQHLELHSMVHMSPGDCFDDLDHLPESVFFDWDFYENRRPPESLDTDELLHCSPQHLTKLVSLAITCPHSVYPNTVTVAGLSVLTNLQQLELALPCERLEGLSQVAAACTQLTQLKLTAHRAHDGSRRYLPHETITWPSLQEAYVCMPPADLARLGLHSGTTAPNLQRLFLLLADCTGEPGHLDALRAACTKLLDCPALQPQLVLSRVKNLTAVLGALQSLAPRLDDLCLLSTASNVGPVTSDQLGPALRALGLSSLSIIQAADSIRQAILNCDHGIPNITLGGAQPDVAALDQYIPKFQLCFEEHTDKDGGISSDLHYMKGIRAQRRKDIKFDRLMRGKF